MFLFPLVNLTAFFAVVYHKLNKDASQSYLTYMLIKDNIDTIKNYLYQDRKDKINETLIQMNYYADELYEANVKI